MKRAERLRALTAYHEAGHAVAAWWLRLPFLYVTIEANSNSLGHVQFRRFPRWFLEDEASDRGYLLSQRHTVSSFAGQIAQAKFQKRTPRWGMEADNHSAVDMAFRQCGSARTAQAYVDYCFSASRDLVDANWPAIEAVAAALLERGKLTHGDVIEVIMPGAAALREQLTAAAKTMKKGKA